MSAFTYLFPLLAIAGMAFWYFRMHQKGAAMGGGIAEGFAQAQKEKWGTLIAPDEQIQVWGSGVLWRPAWQYWLAKQVPLLKLVWPMTSYTMVVTDRGRMLMATNTTFGGLSNQEGHERGTARISDAVEQPTPWLIKMNPLYKDANYAMFSGTLNLPTRAVKLYGIPGTFVSALNA